LHALGLMQLGIYSDERARSSFSFLQIAKLELVDIIDELTDETGFRTRYVPLCLVNYRIALGGEIHGSSQASPRDRYETSGGREMRGRE